MIRTIASRNQIRYGSREGMKPRSNPCTRSSMKPNKSCIDEADRAMSKRALYQMIICCLCCIRAMRKKVAEGSVSRNRPTGWRSAAASTPRELFKMRMISCAKRSAATPGWTATSACGSDFLSCRGYSVVVNAGADRFITVTLSFTVICPKSWLRACIEAP